MIFTSQLVSNLPPSAQVAFIVQSYGIIKRSLPSLSYESNNPCTSCQNDKFRATTSIYPFHHLIASITFQIKASALHMTLSIVPSLYVHPSTPFATSLCIYVCIYGRILKHPPPSPPSCTHIHEPSPRHIHPHLHKCILYICIYTYMDKQILAGTKASKIIV